MDTINLCKVYGNNEDASPYIYLKKPLLLMDALD